MKTITWGVWSRYRTYQRWKKIAADRISRIPLNGNEDNTQKSTYQQEIVSEINDTEELPEVNFPINRKLIQKYQRAEPRITAKYKNSTYHKGCFLGGTIWVGLELELQCTANATVNSQREIFKN